MFYVLIKERERGDKMLINEKILSMNFLLFFIPLLVIKYLYHIYMTVNAKRKKKFEKRLTVGQL